ncbi:hypothetical protein OEZ86_006361 [Tetradesmus obliquus]|nr:hypothetical protein OEZ86_006361 [Tetradesmus obliquus]
MPANESSSALAAPALHSAASLFLDLKLPFKHFVETYAAEPALHTSSSSSSSSSSSVEAWADWWSHGSPLTLVHLLALAAPTASVALLQALLRTASKGGLQGPAALFKHELTLHAGINAGRITSCASIAYPACPGLRLIAHKEHPLLLALSPSPLQPGLANLSNIKQLFSSFAWAEDMAVATLLLPESVAEACPSWARYITLCVARSLLTVTLSEAPANNKKKKGAKQQHGRDGGAAAGGAAPTALLDGQLSVQLPQGVEEGQPAATKMSRATGLLVVRVATRSSGAS